MPPRRTFPWAGFFGQMGRTMSSFLRTPFRSASRLGLVLAVLPFAAQGAESLTQRVDELDAAPLAKKAKEDGAVVMHSEARVGDDGSATLRVELSKKVPVQKSVAGTEVRFFLEGARITIKNNKNPLLAQHFSTNVVSAEVVPSKTGVTVVLRLRQPVALEAQVVDQAGGASTVRVDIPALEKSSTPSR
jgi:hypothetical protein